MSQVVTPEEMAALLEGLREAEGGPGSLHRDLGTVNNLLLQFRVMCYS